MRNALKSLFIGLACLMAGSVWAETIFSFTVTSSTIKKGSYTAQGGTAECTKDMASSGSNEITIGSQTFYKFNSSSEWNFTLSGNTLAVGDVLTFTCACQSGNDKKGKGLIVNGVTVTGDFPKNTANTLTITVAANDEFVGKNVVNVKRADSDIKFGTIEITRGGSTPPTPVAVTGVKLNKTSLTLEAGKSEALTATVEPSNADNKNVTWASDKTGVATVDANGLVSAISAGTANITVTTEDGSKTATCVVTVTAPAAPIPVTGISLNKQTTSIYVGKTETLTVNYTPTNANTGKGITWSSDKTGVATVANGVVTGVAVGTAVITATSEGGFTATCTVTVAEAPVVHPSSVSLNKSTTSIKIGSNETLTATVLPADANNKNVTWSSDQPGIATVNNGVVTGVAEGTAVITVTTEDGGKTAPCTVTVTAAAPVPQTDLTIHVPEVYEAKDLAGGYDGKLRVVNGREYEVYYPGKTDKTSYASVCVKPETQKQEGMTTNTSATYTKAKDGWFEANIAGISNASLTENAEFEAASSNVMHKMANNNAYKFHVKGFDQFSILAKDKKLDTSSDHSKPNNDQLFDVYIDDVVQPRQSDKDNITIRRFDMSTAEHVIEVRAINSGNSELYGFSLRVAQEPRTKWLKGNDSTQVILQTQSIQPVTYVTKYNNIPGAETRLLWKGQAAADIDLQKIPGELTDTLLLSGVANCAVGEYEYAVVGYYNGRETSRATGKFKVATDIQAMSELNAEVYQGEEMDQISFRYYALNASAVQLSWPNGQPVGIEGKGAKSNTYIIGGTTTAAEGKYPYEITIAGADKILKGTITVRKLDYGTNPVLFLYKNNKNNNGVLTYLQSKNWNIIDRKVKEDGPRTSEQYSHYKWVLISEDADADNKEVQAVARGESNLPVLNMNAFSYGFERIEGTVNSWGEADNGSLSNEGCFVTVQRDDHPIFKALKKKRGDKIQVLDTVNGKGLMPINIMLQGTLCLATSPTRNIEDYFADGPMQTALHEIPAAMRGGTTKYICFPLANNSSKNLTKDGEKLIDAIVSYLMNNEATVTVPAVQITGFSINGIAGDIDQVNKTIRVLIDRTKYPDFDLKEVTPVVTVASPYTTVTPASGETVDLSTSAVLPVKYVVTDYINRAVYNVVVNTYDPQGIEEVYTEGDWVNVYDIFGRKIATTNENIYTMELPRGVYIIVTETGQTLKITR